MSAANDGDICKLLPKPWLVLGFIFQLVDLPRLDPPTCIKYNQLFVDLKSPAALKGALP